MRVLAVSTYALLATSGLIACANESGTPSAPPTAQGGTATTLAGLGGRSATGTVTAIGGTASGGVIGNGGRPAIGGITGSGGNSPTGGNTAAGGATTAKGGTTSTGGASNKGGTTSTGGASSKGGTTSTGGASSKGGTTSTGGASNKGGTTSTGGASSKGGTTSTGGAATGGSTTGGPTVPPLTNGTQGKTTRYWDCCKPSCGWATNAQQGGKSSPATSCDKSGANTVGANTESVCAGGTAYQCNWGAPWEVSSTLSYGFAAYNGSNCGKCYQVDFTGTGDNAGAVSLKGKSMIVQAINIGTIAANQFDLLIPGGGVGANNGCSGTNGMWTSGANLGATYGGFLATCGTTTSCVTDMCTAAFGSNASLMSGCNWFIGWFAAGNNPGIVYAEVACPAAITAKSGLM